MPVPALFCRWCHNGRSTCMFKKLGGKWWRRAACGMVDRKQGDSQTGRQSGEGASFVLVTTTCSQGLTQGPLRTVLSDGFVSPARSKGLPVGTTSKRFHHLLTALCGGQVSNSGALRGQRHCHHSWTGPLQKNFRTLLLWPGLQNQVKDNLLDFFGSQ